MTPDEKVEEVIEMLDGKEYVGVVKQVIRGVKVNLYYTDLDWTVVNPGKEYSVGDRMFIDADVVKELHVIPTGKRYETG